MTAVSNRDGATGLAGRPECACRWGDGIRIFVALIKAAAPANRWSRVLLVYMGLLAASVNGKSPSQPATSSHLMSACEMQQGRLIPTSTAACPFPLPPPTPPPPPSLCASPRLECKSSSVASSGGGGTERLHFGLSLTYWERRRAWMCSGDSGSLLVSGPPPPNPHHHLYTPSSSKSPLLGSAAAGSLRLLLDPCFLG